MYYSILKIFYPNAFNDLFTFINKTGNIVWTSHFQKKNDSNYEIVSYGFLQGSLKAKTMITADIEIVVDGKPTSLGNKILFFDYESASGNVFELKHTFLRHSGSVPSFFSFFTTTSDQLEAELKFISVDIHNLKEECIQFDRLEEISGLSNTISCKLSIVFDISDIHQNKYEWEQGLLNCDLQLRFLNEAAQILLSISIKNFIYRDFENNHKKVKITAITQLTLGGITIPQKERLEIDFHDIRTAEEILFEMPETEFRQYPKFLENKKVSVELQISILKLELLQLEELVEEEGEEDGKLSLHYKFHPFSSGESEPIYYQNMEWKLGYRENYFSSYFYFSVVPLDLSGDYRFHLSADVLIYVEEEGMKEKFRVDQEISSEIFLMDESQSLFSNCVRNADPLVTLELTNITIENFGSNKRVREVCDRANENCLTFSETFRKNFKSSQNSPFHRKEKTEWSLHLRSRDEIVRICLFAKPSDDFVCPGEIWEITADVGCTVDGRAFPIRKEMSFRQAFLENSSPGKILLEKLEEENLEKYMKLLTGQENSFSATVKIWNIRTKNIRKFGALNFRNSFLEDSDMKILIGEENVFCHSQILSLSSPVFKNLIRTRRENSVEITLPPGHSIEDFFQFLHQLYFPAEPIREGNLECLLHYAAEFEVETILKILEEFLIELSWKNRGKFSYLDVFLISWKHQMEKLKVVSFGKWSTSESFMNWEEIMSNEYYQTIKTELKLKFIEFVMAIVKK